MLFFFCKRLSTGFPAEKKKAGQDIFLPDTLTATSCPRPTTGRRWCRSTAACAHTCSSWLHLLGLKTTALRWVSMLYCTNLDTFWASAAALFMTTPWKPLQVIAFFMTPARCTVFNQWRGSRFRVWCGEGGVTGGFLSARSFYIPPWGVILQH